MSSSARVLLGVNIDHIATLRQQRQGNLPDPVYAGLTAEAHGADGIVAHLREDRRHIQERDVRLLRQVLQTRLNLEMAATEAMESIALDVLPQRVCIVPEKRQELTTEGGLDVIANRMRLKKLISRLSAKKIEVSLFIDPDADQIKCARSLGAYAVELHTGRYADSPEGPAREKEFTALLKAADLAGRLRLHLHAGHGLDYRNVQRVACIPGMEELNIGFSIMARAVFIGLGPAVKEMKDLINH
jgi:pyridoxine 5-phosphate synthase